MKIGFIVTTHHSKKLRKQGRKLIEEYLVSLKKSCKYPYTVWVMDNGSTDLMDNNLVDENTRYVFIKDQFKTGITGAWNRGINAAITEGNDIIINTNDDIIFNETINNLIDVINTHQFKNTSIYGPVTNKSGSDKNNNQGRESIGDRILEVTLNSPKSWNGGAGINGFFTAFNKECYHNFKVDGNLFSTHKTYKINGQESEMQIRLAKKGLKSFIVESCMVHHEKIRGWQQIRNR